MLATGPSLRYALPVALVAALVSPTKPAAAAPSPRPSAKKAPSATKSRARRSRRRGTGKTLPAVLLGRKHVSPERGRSSPPADPTPGSLKGNGGGGSLPPPPTNDVQTNTNGDLSFTITPNTPFIPFAGRLEAHYPRDWETSAYNPGHVWISNNRLPGETYVDAKIFVQPGYEYRVDLCTRSNSGQTIQAEVGDVTHTFDAGVSISDCDLSLVLQPSAQGWTKIRLSFPGTSGGAFALNQVKVLRTET